MTIEEEGNILWETFCKRRRIYLFNENFEKILKDITTLFFEVEDKLLHNIERETEKIQFNRKKVHIKNDYEYNLDGELAHLLDCLAIDAKEDNDDALIVMLGPEGAGKTYLASQMCNYLSEKLGVPVTIDNVHFDGESYLNSSIDGEPLQINILDESKRVLNKMRTTSKSNVNFMNYFSECRDQNQIHLLTLPSFTDLDSSAAIWRNKLMISVDKTRDPITNRIVRGNFNIWSTTDKGLLKKAQTKRYESLPKEMLYYKGTFENVLCYPLEEYKAKKMQAKKDRYYTKVEDKGKVLDNKTIVRLTKIKTMRDMGETWNSVGKSLGMTHSGAIRWWDAHKKDLISE